MAESKFLTFLQIQKLKNFELYESKLHQPVLKFKGDLQVLYSHAQDLVILKIHNNTFLLDKSVQIIGCYYQAQGWIDYVFCNAGGFFVLRHTGIDKVYGLDNSLLNFETLLENRSNFVRNNKLIDALKYFRDQTKEGESGLEQIRDAIVKNVTDLVDTLSHSDDQDHPNHKIRMSAEQLLSADSTSVPVVDMSEYDISLLKEASHIIVKEHQGIGEWSQLWSTYGASQPQGRRYSNMPEPVEGELQHKKSTGTEKLGESGYHDHQTAPQGKHHHDGQEVLGGENQRLPSYEVHQSTEQIQQGMEKASSHIFENKSSPQKEKGDSSEFTTGLLKGDLPNESPVTPYHKNEQPGVPDTQPREQQKEKIEPSENKDVAAA